MFRLEGLAVHEGLFLFFYRLFNKIVCLYSLFILSYPFSGKEFWLCRAGDTGFCTTRYHIVVDRSHPVVFCNNIVI
jgi:hypothetical protein